MPYFSLPFLAIGMERVWSLWVWCGLVGLHVTLSSHRERNQPLNGITERAWPLFAQPCSLERFAIFIPVGSKEHDTCHLQDCRTTIPLPQKRAVFCAGLSASRLSARKACPWRRAPSACSGAGTGDACCGAPGTGPGRRLRGGEKAVLPNPPLKGLFRGFRWV